MYKLKIIKWDVTIPQKDGSIVSTQECLIDAIKYLLSISEPKQGFENFMIMHNIAESFNKIDEGEEELQLQSREYDFIVELIKDKIPSQWAMNKNISSEITKFMNLKK